MIIHNIIVVQWLLIKTLSAVINDWEQIEVIVPGGCYLDIIYTQNRPKIKMLRNFWCENLAG